ncbi:MAG: hypothetical protein LBV40_04150 [Methanomicrobiales archaeon]|nr:hypothetical protein [Methanomicrobiales archaeon]
MKIPRNILVLSSFVVTFVTILIATAVAGTFFQPTPMKALLIAAYFAGWVALFVFCICAFLPPKEEITGEVAAMLLGTHKERETQKKSESFPSPAEEIKNRSPHSELPVRERIAAYVMERRREEGIPAPVPLFQSSVEEKRGTFPGSFSPPGVASVAAASYVTSFMNDTKAFSGFGGDPEVDPIPDIVGEIRSNDDAYDFLDLNGDFSVKSDLLGNNLDDIGDFGGSDDDKKMRFVDALEGGDAPDAEFSHDEFLAYDAFMERKELLLSDDDFLDIGEIDLEPHDLYMK